MGTDTGGFSPAAKGKKGQRKGRGKCLDKMDAGARGVQYLPTFKVEFREMRLGRNQKRGQGVELRRGTFRYLGKADLLIGEKNPPTVEGEVTTIEKRDLAQWERAFWRKRRRSKGMGSVTHAQIRERGKKGRRES